jgi:hypothetical protein
MRRPPLYVLLSVGISGGAVAQTPAHQHPNTGAAKVADGLRAARPFITKGATIVDWPRTPIGEYSVLCKGTTEWTCLSASPLYPRDEPIRADAAFFKWFQQSVADEQPPHVDTVGISYMYTGGCVRDLRSNASHSPDHTFHVGRIS